MRIQIDPDADVFLRDHVVDGSPLLPTVMQLDLVARALAARMAGTGTAHPTGARLRDVRVGPPVRFGGSGSRSLDLIYRPAPTAPHYELRSSGYGVPHLMARAEPAAEAAPRAPELAGLAGDLRCGPDLVYPPFFHGPAFRAVGAFGRVGNNGMAAVLASGLPPLRWAAGPTVLQPRLLELLLQCCGLHELAVTGRMMVPASLEAVHWYAGPLAAGHQGSAVAVVRARPGPGPRDSVFDGQVVTPGGTVLLTVTGYRSTDLGHPANLAHAGRLARYLTSHSAPVPHSLAGIAPPEGGYR